MKNKYYCLDRILEKNAQYNMIFGERSNGKTYAALKYCLDQYIRFGSQFAIVRREREDFIGKRGSTMFTNLVANNEIDKLTQGLWNDVYYYSGRWYLCCYDGEGKRYTDEQPFAYGFAISSGEHDKSTSYPGIKNIVFDEFLSRKGYLPDEFVQFMNTLSTIIRQRDDVKIFMLGNTVNQYCPYFNEMGLTHIKNMKPGDIDIYRYGDSKLKVAVEYTRSTPGGKKSDTYFAFDNPKLSMITGGTWEIDVYPHCPEKFKPKDIIFTYFIIFDRDVLQCEVVQTETNVFTFVHKKTTPLKDPDRDIIFSTDFDPRPNHYRKITRPTDKLTEKIAYFYKRDKIFYADNETGEIMRNYLMWCGKAVK